MTRGDRAWLAWSGGPSGRRVDVAGGRVDATSGHRGQLLAELAEQAVHAVVPARALREQVVVEQVLQRAVGVVARVPGEREHLLGVEAAAARASRGALPTGSGRGHGQGAEQVATGRPQSLVG